jgi:hypothetical protein
MKSFHHHHFLHFHQHQLGDVELDPVERQTDKKIESIRFHFVSKDTFKTCCHIFTELTAQTNMAISRVFQQNHQQRFTTPTLPTPSPTPTLEQQGEYTTHLHCSSFERKQDPGF